MINFIFFVFFCLSMLIICHMSVLFPYALLSVIEVTYIDLKQRFVIGNVIEIEIFFVV